ncbi:MAG: hypothetical protein NUV58_03235 [Candidatus Roizmanbacteria bacterium]|nr:hypothetical protein [Candidatus Roizmanbacteria bacterium]
MKVTINEKKDNSLLGRVEVKGTLSFEGATPSNAKLAESIAKEFKIDVNLVVMKQIHTKFSRQEANFLVLVYKNMETKVKAERMTKHLKKRAEEASKKAAEAKAAEEEAKAAEEEAKKAATEDNKEE